MIGEIVISGIAMIISALAFVNSFSFPGGTSDGVPGAGFFPQVLCVVIFVLNILVIIKAIQKLRKTENQRKPFTNEQKQGLIKIAIVIVATIVMIVLWGTIHFVVICAVYLCIIGVVLRLDLKKYIPGAVVASIAIYFIFQNLLNVMLNN
ncbi:MAG: tripartite tricarboxylate transporter TctB family protein [Hespellia sp.]|nr:tripartite tricarboxylate transporter TctB family protein [Hespellia sp.]